MAYKMRLRAILLTGLLWLLLLAGASYTDWFTASAQQPSEQPGEQLSEQLSSQQLNQIAHAITVQVFAGENRGSGILIQRQGNRYWVLTNQHVVLPGAPYEIVTPDNQGHSADLINRPWTDADLALLSFESSSDYAVAQLGSSSALTLDDPVFAAGFPYNSESLSITSGQIALLPSQAFRNGYQLGYTNSIQLGMSGGPLLNQQGELVGINGMSSFPILNSAYVFTDGSRPDQTELQEIRRASWAIPIQTLKRLQADPQSSFNSIPAEIQFERLR